MESKREVKNLVITVATSVEKNGEVPVLFRVQNVVAAEWRRRKEEALMNAIIMQNSIFAIIKKETEKKGKWVGTIGGKISWYSCLWVKGIECECKL